MDKNTVIGLLLMFALIFGVQYYTTPSKEELAAIEADQAENRKREEAIQLSEAANVRDNEVLSAEIAEPDSIALSQLDNENIQRYGVFAPAVQGNSEEISLENSVLKVDISTKGGTFYRATLKDGYKTYWDSTAIRLWDEKTSEMAFLFNYPGKGDFSSRDFYFSPSEKIAVATENQAAEVTMRLHTSSPEKYLEVRYSLPEGSHEVRCQIKAVGLDREMNMADKGIALKWDAQGNHNEKGISLEQQRSAVYYRMLDAERDYLSDGREDEETLTEGSLHWMAFKQNYFSAAVIADAGFREGAFIKSFPCEETDSLHNMHYQALLPLKMEASQTAAPLRFFFGPNDYKILKATKVEEFNRIIDYGWWIFGWVNRNIVRPVFTFLSLHIANAGIVIVILTLLIKSALFPITWKNYLSSAKMRVLKPEMDEINKKFEGKDAAAKQQATMALYRDTGVNPFAGCLPVLLQMPILYAMFRFFPASIELRGKGFLWADDLGAYDAIFSWSTQIPILSSIYGNHVSGFTVLMAASTFFYTRMNSANMPTTQQPGMPDMKVIMNIFPLIMLILFNKFASGLSLYYFIANVVSIGQMALIKEYFVDEVKIRSKIEANKKKPKKKSGFQQRLEDAQKMAQQQKALRDKSKK